MVLIKIKDGYHFEGGGETIGKDVDGTLITFWKMAGNMDVPAELAIQLEKEVPQRYEFVDRELAKKCCGDSSFVVKVETPKEAPIVIIKEVIKEVYVDAPVKPENKELKESKLTLKILNGWDKEMLNDEAAKMGYDLSFKDKKQDMVNKLVDQIHKRTGIVIPK